jgi:hypothetical protein
MSRAFGYSSYTRSSTTFTLPLIYIVAFNTLAPFAAYQFSVLCSCRVSMRDSVLYLIQVFTSPSSDVSSVFYITRTSQSFSHSTDITSLAHHTSLTLFQRFSQSCSYVLLSSVSIPLSSIYPDDRHLLWLHQELKDSQYSHSSLCITLCSQIYFESQLGRLHFQTILTPSLTRDINGLGPSRLRACTLRDQLHEPSLACDAWVGEAGRHRLCSLRFWWFTVSGRASASLPSRFRFVF